ncbi:MAG: hypothetical protein KJ674_04410 [Nanoarchaeota archaeon]|nr:hypothetical protein [Nanoarchaeota archaeon]
MGVKTKLNYFKIGIILFILIFISSISYSENYSKNSTEIIENSESFSLDESISTNINSLEEETVLNDEEEIIEEEIRTNEEEKPLRLPETFHYKSFIDKSSEYDFEDVDADLISAYNIIGQGYGESVQTLQIKNTIDKHNYKLIISYPSDSKFKELDLSNDSIEYREINTPENFYNKISDLKQKVIPPQDYIHKAYEITTENNTILGITAIISHDNTNKKRWYLNLIGSSGGTSLLYQTGDFSVYDMNSNVWWRRLLINTNIEADTFIRIPHMIDEVTDDGNITELHPAILKNSTVTFIGTRWKSTSRLQRYNETHFEWQPDFNLTSGDEFRIGIGLQYHFYSNTTANSSEIQVDLSVNDFPIYLNWTGGFNNLSHTGTISGGAYASCFKDYNQQSCVETDYGGGTYYKYYTNADESWFGLTSQSACSSTGSSPSGNPTLCDFSIESIQTIPTWGGCNLQVSCGSAPCDYTNYGGDLIFYKDTATSFSGTSSAYAWSGGGEGFTCSVSSTVTASGFGERASWYPFDINLTINGNGSYFNESGDLTWDEFKTSPNLQSAFNTGTNNIVLSQSEVYGGEIAFYFNYQEEIPIASNIGINETEPETNQIVLHYANWVDDSLAGYIFSSNYSGTWSNDSWVEMTGTNNWSNYSKVVAPTIGTYGWRIYANDSEGNWGDTGIQYINVVPGTNNPPTINLVNITPQTPHTEDDLDCGVKVIDPDIWNTLTANITWFKNGEPWTEDNEYMSVTNNEINHTSDIGDIESYKTSNGDEWICSVNAFDGYDWSGWKNSTSVVIYNDLQVNDLSIIYQFDTERIFRFEILNQLNYTINVSWKLETGESTINSLYNSTLQEDEDIFVYLHYNYTSPGNYLVKATAYGGGLTDSESINITII